MEKLSDCPFVFAVFVFFCCATDCVVIAQTTTSEKYKQDLLNDTDQPVSVAEAIPSSVTKQLARVSGDPGFRLANPNERFNATDIILKDRANRRLCFATKSATHYLVCYERGGYVKSKCVVAVRLVGQSLTTPVWAAMVPNECNTLEGLRQAYRSHQLIEHLFTVTDF